MRAHYIRKPCSQQINSAYAQAVLADSPVAYWQMQECFGLPRDSSPNARNTDSSTGGTFFYRLDGPLSDGRDKSILWAGGDAFFRSSVVSTVTDGFTIEMIVYIEDIGGNDEVMFYNGDGGANGWGMTINIAGQIKYLAGGVAGSGPSTGAVPWNSWHHVVLRRDGDWDVFIDGAYDSTIGSDTPNTPSSVAVNATQIGGGSVQNRWAHIAVYDTALDDTTIADHFAASGL